MTKTLKARLEDLEKSKHEDDLIIIPSWGDYVYIKGEAIPKAEYKPDPNTPTIKLTWGDDEPTTDK